MRQVHHILPFLWMRGESEEIIREEIAKICECGIREVCLEARPHRDFCGPGWWHDVDIVLDEARQRDMRVWILDDKHFPTGYANGLIEEKYPERRKLYLNYQSADIFGASRPLTIDVNEMKKPTVKFWELDKANDPERENNEVYAVVAIRFADGNVFCESDGISPERVIHDAGDGASKQPGDERMKVDAAPCVIDLTSQVTDGCLTFRLPEGAWKLLVIYKTRTDGGNSAYINFLDEVSAHTQIEGVYEAHYEKYREEFGKTIAGFFSDEPQFGNEDGFGFGAVLGKDHMPIPWSDEMESLLKETYGDRLNRVLPWLWHDTDRMQECAELRYRYMDIASRLYQKNFSDAIGSWCAERGVEYIGHVIEDGSSHSRLGAGAAHYFRAMSGQHMAGIDCIGGQIVVGAPNQKRTDMVSIDGEFNHYTLGKLGASEAHLDPVKKGRLMCELFGAYGWTFGVRDMKYVLDHLLSRGVNYLVPHAFSMAEYPDTDCPPHFYARGNNPQFAYFAQLMKYAERMCSLFDGGKHVPDVAVLYDGEADWCGERMPLQKVARELITHQIDFDIVPTDALKADRERYRTYVDADAGKFCVGGMEFRALVVPYCQHLAADAAGFIARFPEIPVYFVDAHPEDVVGCGGAGGSEGMSIAGKKKPADGGGQVSDYEEAYDERKSLLEDISVRPAVPLKNLAAELRDRGYTAMAAETADGEIPKDLTIYHYKTSRGEKGRNRYLILNESACETFTGEVSLPGESGLVINEPFFGRVRKLRRGEDGAVRLELTPLQCVVIEEDDKSDNHLPPYIRRSEAEVKGSITVDLSETAHPWMVSKCRAIEYGEEKNFPEEEMTVLHPVSDDDPTFSGIIRYRKTLVLSEKQAKTARSLGAMLAFGEVYEVMRVRVNGADMGMVLQAPYEIAIGSMLFEGENEILVEVATTPDREQELYPKPPFTMKYEAHEPTGIAGDAKLIVGMNI